MTKTETPWRRSGCQSGAAGRQCHGVHEFVAELNTKRLEILKDAVPRLARVGHSGSRAENQTNPQLKEIRPAAARAEAEIGGDRDSIRRQRIRERFSNPQSRSR